MLHSIFGSKKFWKIDPDFDQDDEEERLSIRETKTAFSICLPDNHQANGFHHYGLQAGDLVNLKL